MASHEDKARVAAEAQRRTIYKVVVNHEEQYTIWPTDRKLPSGWSESGRTGTQDECYDYIRRRSLRDGK